MLDADEEAARVSDGDGDVRGRKVRRMEYVEGTRWGATLGEGEGELLTAGSAGVTVIGDGGKGVVAILAREDGGELAGIVAAKENGNDKLSRRW